MASITTQTALLLLAKQGKFAVVPRPVPKPGTGEILIKILAAGLNPVDWKIQQYGFAVEEYPAVIGQDIAGVVEEIGQGVTTFARGDKV